MRVQTLLHFPQFLGMGVGCSFHKSKQGNELQHCPWQLVLAIILKGAEVMRNLFSFLIIFLCLATCDSDNAKLQFPTVTFSNATQQFTIVSFYQHMPMYIEKARQNRHQIDRLYKKHVFNPLWNDFASTGECSFLANSLKHPIADLEGFGKEVEALARSGAEEIVKNALLKASDVLPGPNTTVYVQAIDPVYKKYMPENLRTGIIAHTFGAGKIFITIDPFSPNWENQLRKVVAHEYHHSVWISRKFETVNFSLLEYLILEGRADNFAEMVYPAIESPWTNLFDSAKERDVWQYMKTVLDVRDAQLNMRMVT
ncbi:hypothetical protein GF337_19995, partial [candidate division KSB1 bacterium]|nr:hypothetical protein [candidate division KSB1 bacterium]